jgi:hypothetical protein
VDERLDANAAKTLIRQIATTGNIRYVKPDFAQLLAKRNLTTADIVNVLLRGRVGEAEYENGSWRYPVYTNTIHVVAEIDTVTELLVITAWRIK